MQQVFFFCTNCTVAIDISMPINILLKGEVVGCGVVGGCGRLKGQFRNRPHSEPKANTN